MPWTTYKERVRALSDKIVDVQKPIRVLDAVKWDPSVEEEFFATKSKRLPKVDAEYYRRTPLGFDPKKKDSELTDLIRDVRAQLGHEDELGKLLVRIVEEYREVVVMLEARGTTGFYEASRRLYGSPKDRLLSGSVSVGEQGRVMYSILTQLEAKFLGQEYPKELSSDDVVAELRRRFDSSFLAGLVDVRPDDGIVADAAAGSDVIKIKEGAVFSRKDIDIFEVHEGWVHIATTLNGKSQKVARFLSKGPPRCVATQEGLALLMEILTFSTYPLRARTINDRIIAVDKAEDGANFLDLYEFYQTEGYSDAEAFRNSMRIFRGSHVEGGAPFTKDISYTRGFIENYNFMRTAIRKGRPELVPFLFAGKLHVDDIPLLYQRSLDGVVNPPKLLPPQFQDLNGLAVWMGFSNFLNAVDLERVGAHYDALFRKFL